MDHGPGPGQRGDTKWRLGCPRQHCRGPCHGFVASEAARGDETRSVPPLSGGRTRTKAPSRPSAATRSAFTDDECKVSGPDRHILPLGTSLVKVGWRARTQNEGPWNARGDLPRQWFLPCAFSLLGTHVSPSGWLLPPPRGHICLSAHPVGAIHRYTGLDSRFPNDARIPVLPPPASLMTLVECELWLRSFPLVTGKLLVLPRRWLTPSTRCL